MNEFIAHVRKEDNVIQTVREHLEGVAKISRSCAAKIGLADLGELIGLLHDLGKYSLDFQNYIKSGTGLLKIGDVEFVDVDEKKGKIDHSTAGARFIWRELSKKGMWGRLVGQALFLCVCSHHSGLIDCLVPDPVEDNFKRRVNKDDKYVKFEEVMSKVEDEIVRRSLEIIENPSFIDGIKDIITSISINSNKSKIISTFQTGLLVRYIFSGLIDADRTDTADFEKPIFSKFRLNGKYVPWDVLINRLEHNVSLYESGMRRIDFIRNRVSRHCFEAATKDRGIFKITVPTGGAKTLSSLRFALHHAKAHGLDRVFYIIPFTSIIDQNADVVREILEPDGRSEGNAQVVLEHHCNVINERLNDNDELESKWKDKSRIWKDRILTENWDAPIVFTTNVQLLEALFGSGTRNVRRLHQLANSVIIFDEIQTLPIRCIHMFNNAINFLVEQCGCSVVLCSATQPLLDLVDIKKGALKQALEIIPDVQGLFDDLKRVSVRDCRKPDGWQAEDIGAFAQEQAEKSGSCLVVVNTKKTSKAVYLALKDTKFPLYHLSTNMCPNHRRHILDKVRSHLKHKENVICVSTQLIEAGVDVDFGSVIRCLAGLDSIAQAAGRCNRNGEHEMGVVSIINPVKDIEFIDSLVDIKKGIDVSKRILNDFKENPQKFGNDIIGLAAMNAFYEGYFFNRRNEMEYRVKAERVGRDDTLLQLLSKNELSVESYKRTCVDIDNNMMWQSFATAAKEFHPIDSITTGIVVPYKEGCEIINELRVADLEKEFKLLRRAQQFTVNVFETDFKKLTELGALHPIQEDSSIFYLDDGYYNDDFGVASRIV
jgi:CRISPR-associated endonuclease/helicase Cas3